jgi:hypothetical protein
MAKKPTRPVPERPAPVRPAYESGLLNLWAQELPEPIWGECTFSEGVSPGELLVTLSGRVGSPHLKEMNTARDLLMRMIDRRLVEAEAFERVLIEAKRGAGG